MAQSSESAVLPDHSGATMTPQSVSNCHTRAGAHVVQLYESAAFAGDADDGRAAPTAGAFGEMVDVLCKRGRPDAALRLEEMWNELVGARSLSLMCAYERGSFPHPSDGAHFAGICDAHSRVLPAGAYSALERDDDRSRQIERLQQRAGTLEGEVEADPRGRHRHDPVGASDAR